MSVCTELNCTILRNSSTILSVTLLQTLENRKSHSEYKTIQLETVWFFIAIYISMLFVHTHTHTRTQTNDK